VSFPELIVADLRAHLDNSTSQGDNDLVFTSPTGTPLRHGNFRRRVWLSALTPASGESMTWADELLQDGAPGASRTRDLLLRRQLLYPLSYRG
jgi:hypothetical protein